MKHISFILTVLAFAGFATFAQASTSITCIGDHEPRITLGYEHAWWLSDADEPSLQSPRELRAFSDTLGAVSFLYDFGSDSSKYLYEFTGLKECGLHAPTTPVVKLTKSLVSSDGTVTLSSLDCTCTTE